MQEEKTLPPVQRVMRNKLFSGKNADISQRWPERKVSAATFALRLYVHSTAHGSPPPRKGLSLNGCHLVTVVLNERFREVDLQLNGNA